MLVGRSRTCGCLDHRVQQEKGRCNNAVSLYISAEDDVKCVAFREKKKKDVVAGLCFTVYCTQFESRSTEGSRPSEPLKMHNQANLMA